MMKIAAVGAVIAILGVIGACGGFQWLTKGISNVASLITVAFLMTLLCWGVLCLIGNDWIYGQRKKYLFGILFAINIISMDRSGTVTAWHKICDCNCSSSSDFAHV